MLTNTKFETPIGPMRTAPESGLSSPIQIGTLGWNVVMDVPRNCKRIIDIPAGARIRLRLRAGHFAKVFVRTANGLQSYLVEDVGQFWKLGQLLGENRTLKS
jgi:hypothetical protein